MTNPSDTHGVHVRTAGPDDVHLAHAACDLIASVAEDFDIALRSDDFITKKIAGGQAALALDDGELVGFGYWSAWQEGTFVSHSGLVVRRDRHGLGLGRRLKDALFESSRRRLPNAKVMSLTTSPQVKALNHSLGLRDVPLEELTNDPAFWEGCTTCRNYEEVRARGEICCCEGMLFDPSAADESNAKEPE